MHPRMTAHQAPYEPQLRASVATSENPLAVGSVVVLGFVIATAAALTLLGAITAPSYSATGGKTVFTLVACGDTALGIGIILRLDLARQIYVVLTSIGVVLAAIAIVVALATGQSLAT